MSNRFFLSMIGYVVCSFIGVDSQENSLRHITYKTQASLVYINVPPMMRTWSNMYWCIVLEHIVTAMSHPFRNKRYR